ncbi:MAG: hypothetical protein JWM51_1719 [Microbacteriaceae bacterium]|nr:hypothetical protein [Microbacteriaceae bacterium]
MSTAALPLVDARDIIRLVGPGSYQRAQVYTRGGAVTELEWDPESGLLSSTVLGTQPEPYRCHIELAPARAGFERPVSGNCSCPVGLSCKHVAATLLECNAAQLRKGAVASDLLAASAGGTASGSVADSVRPSAQPAAQPADWKTALTRVTAAPSHADSPIALQFELREQTPRTRDRWRGPTAVTATARAANVEYRLGVRPAIRSAAGNWVRGNVTWNSLGYQANRLTLDADHQRWFAQFVALYRATTRDVYTGQDSDWLYLDEFHSALLWQLLGEARSLGIELIGPKKDATITVAGLAAVSLDATLDDSGALRLEPRLTIDGQPRNVTAAGVIGDHGVYLAELSPSFGAVLAPTAQPLSGEQRRLLAAASAIVVPKSDVDEFLGDYYSRLRRTVEITSTDDSLELPRLSPPVLVATVRFGDAQSLTLEWAWEYDSGRTTKRLPLDAPLDDTRDLDTERETRAALRAALDDELDDELGDEPGALRLRGVAAAEFSDKTLPVIEGVAGVRVDLVGERPDYRELTETPKLVLKTVESEKRDWFDLGVIVSVDGRNVPFGPLFTALSRGHDKLLLVDNSYLSLDHPVFAELLRLIREASALAEWETTPRISRYQASLWADLEDLADDTEQAVSWRTAVSGLNAIETVESIPVPAGLTATLRPYQQEGFEWLAFLYEHGLGGILADDMGLGKTVQTLALVTHAVARGATAPFLVVAPTSVVSNWVTEAARFTPGLVVRGVSATEKKSGRSLAEHTAGANVIVTSYALFRLDLEAYQQLDWAGLVLDEAQFVKNAASKAHRAAVELRAPLKIAITGTPLENSLLDLWALFDIVAPGLFPSRRRFTDDYVRPITSSAADESPRPAELLSKLRRRIRPLMMRRTKDLVAAELPAKQEQVLRIELAPAHRTLYDTFLQRERQKLLGLIDDMDKNRFIVFRSLTLLRMLSLDASLIDEKYEGVPSSKLDALFEQLDDVVAEGHRALIFSQFTTFLRKTADRLEAHGIAYEYLDGSTLKRADVVSRFKKGDAPVFLISLKAGGFGLNLTEADYVFMLDPWWNPATESQAIDRTHRIGQTKNVMVYRLVASGTIEEKVMALKENKARLFDAVMDDDAVFSSALTADDIRALLEP